jgi:hypothetical protein
MLKDETLYLLAHGTSTTIEGLSAEELAELLVKKGLTSPIWKIKLIACASGVTGGSNLPYCQLLADKIVAKKGPATIVIGFDGETAVTDEHGRTFAKDTSQRNYPNYSTFDKTTYARWDLIAEKLPYGSEKEILENVTKLQPQVQTVFEWLYKNNRIYIKDSIKGKTYGIPGQEF